MPSVSLRSVALTINVQLPDGTPVSDLALRLSHLDGSPLSRRLVQKTDSSGSTTFDVPLEAQMRSVLVRPAVGSARIPRVPASDRLADRIALESHYVIDVPLDATHFDFSITVTRGRVISANLSTQTEFYSYPHEVYFASPSSVGFPNVMLRSAYRCRDEKLVLKNQTAEATTIFLQVGPRVCVKNVPAGSADVDLGTWHLPLLDLYPGNSVCGRFRVSDQLQRKYAGIETGITFYNIDDCRIFSFSFSDQRKAVDIVSAGCRFSEYQLCANQSPMLHLADPIELPAGRYVVVPGPMSAVDFQMSAIRHLSAGLDVSSISYLFFFEVADGQLIELGLIDFDKIVSSFNDLP